MRREQIRHLEFDINPLAVVLLQNAYALMRDLVAGYAKFYNPDSGDTIQEFVNQASFDVYPANQPGLNRERSEFRIALRAAIKSRRVTA